MHNIWLVAKREYLERVRSKAFRISTVLVPLAFGSIFYIAMIAGKMSDANRHIVIVSNDQAFAQGVRDELLRDKDAKFHIDVQQAQSQDQLAPLAVEVERKQLDGYLWVGVTKGQPPEALYVSHSSGDVIVKSRMQDAVRGAVMRNALTQLGLTSEQIGNLQKDVTVSTSSVKNGRLVQSDSTKSFWGAYVMAFILYFAVVFYGMNVAQSVVQEKTSRVFEVLLASAEPESLMLGKLIGVGGAGLTQLGIWVVLALVFSSSALAATMLNGGLGAYGVTPLHITFFILYFVLGFLFYSALSAAFGSTVSNEQELQQFSMIIVMPQMLGFITMPFIMSNPGSPVAIALSLFPPCTPIVMCLRMGAMAVPMWQLLLSLALMGGTIYGLIWLAARIYRVGILMYGKRPTLPEVMRWLKYT